MSLSDFEAHLNTRDPRFRCYDCLDRSEKPTFIAQLKHSINPAASSDDLSMIDHFFGSSFSTAAMKKFYALHDGVRMYEGLHPRRFHGGQFIVSGIEFFRIGQWSKRTDAMRKNFSSMQWSNEEMPDWMRKAVVFAEVSQSGNNFVISPVGENCGKVIYADHDTSDPFFVLGTFDEFLDVIIADPATFLDRMGCYTRYSDGETDTQWIAKEFLSS